MQTIKSIVDAISAQRDVPNDVGPSLSRALRFYRSKDLFKSTKATSGQGKEGEFDDENAAYAFILGYVYLLDMDGNAAAEVRRVFDRTEHVYDSDKNSWANRHIPIRRVLDGIRKGERWQLVFRLQPSGMRAHIVHFKDGKPEPFSHVVARAVIDLNMALRPLAS